MSEALGLAKYDAMCTAIAVCHSVDEVKELRDRAKALEVYARQARNLDAERRCCEVRIRAERRAGELLKEMKETGARDAGAGGDRKSPSPVTTVNRLADLNITRDQSSKWQQLADVPIEQFERALVREDCQKPTTEGIINTHRPPPKEVLPKMDRDAIWIWGKLRDFESTAVLSRSFPVLINGMTETMQEDCRRLLPQVIEWLTKGLA
jgi:hypothetical protein